VPAEHDAQVDPRLAPTAVEYKPAAQLKQLVAPVAEFWYWPAMQFAHALVDDDWPVAVPNVPAAQATQEVAPEEV
jgi:hypothetical protein